MGERIRLSQEKSGARVNYKIFGLNKTESQSNQSPVERILNLQKTIGNQAVTRLIQSGAIQASLKIGQPGDIYEKEADRVAEQVMRMRMPETECPECEEQVEGVQRQVEEEERPAVIPQGSSIAPYLHLKRKTSNLDIPGKRSLQPLYPLQTSPLDIIRRATTPDGEDTGPTDAGKTFCRSGTYLGIFSVGSNTASAAAGKATISSIGSNTGRVGGKSCSCDCGLLRQYIKGYWRWGRGGAKRHNITSCGNNINISESSWTEEYMSCILNKNDCRQNYSDYPGWTNGLSDGTYVELRYDFKYQLWDKCQGRANTVAYNTLTISGSRAPRRIRWSRT